VGFLAIPEIIWEAFLGIYCAIFGFRKDSPIIRPNWRGDAVAWPAPALLAFVVAVWMALRRVLTRGTASAQ
jgi:hypothetical protein